VVLVVKHEPKAESSVAEVESMPKGSSVIGFGVSVDVGVSVTQIDFLVAFGRFVAAGRPLVTWLVFEL